MESRSHQIVEYNSDSIILNEEILRSILTKDEIKDRYVSVISVTGAFRQGKSFLLNFLLRYLRITYIEAKNVTEWLKSEDGPLQGFSWAPGSKRHTNGIHMWSEIFLTTLPSGDDVAIILLDTQGSFDNQSTMDDCARIFALSTLISSVQIYNVMRGIRQYDLAHLQCFGGYGSLLASSGAAPFQNLCFLVRDWACAYEHPFGQTGGSGLLEQVFSGNNSEMKKLVDNIKELFSDISCFLLPYPGRAVDTSNSFDGNLDEIDDNFKQQIQDFVPMLLSPEKLVLKTVNDKKIKAEELLFYILEYTKVLKEGALPEVETLFKATVQAQNKAASFKALKLYKKNMDADVKYNVRCYTHDELYNKHRRYCVESVDYFKLKKKFNDEAMSEKYLIELRDKMDSEFKRYNVINEEKLRKFEIRKREQEERKRRMEEQKRRMEEQFRRTSNQTAGGSGLSTLSTAEKIGIAASVIGGVAVLAIGGSKLLNSSRGKND